MIYLFNMTDREKFEKICDLTTNIVGLDRGSLAEKTRKETIHIPRMVASIVGRLVHDIHPNIIAKVIDRDRTSILHYEKLHTVNYATFPKYRELFNHVYNMYNDILNLKRKFKSKENIRMLLVKSGIDVNVKKPQVYIIIKSGSIVYKLKTNYFYCSENINTIKDVFKDYNYTLEIKTI